jgi:hypothetical protein
VKPYVALSNEILVNFGDEVQSSFDQNRLSISFGVERKQTQYQLGLMNRFVQQTSNQYALNHTLVVWIIQKFDLKKLLKNVDHHDVSSE